MQLSLFPETQTSNVKDKSVFSDPSFASNKLLPVHRWIPWIAGFSSSFVRGVVETKLPQPGTVLDPFAGVGTTLVESALIGHDGVGFEINPYAALACRVKVNAYKLNPEDIQREIGRFQTFYDHSVTSGYLPMSQPPSGFRTRQAFYSPTVLGKVLIVQDFINFLDNEKIQEIFRLAFASTMVHYSNYSYEPSLGTRRAAGKKNIADFAVFELITEKLNQMAMDVKWLSRNLPRHSFQNKIVNASFFDCQQYLKPNSVDLAVTSPPYLNNYHYIRNTRPHLYWLGFVNKPDDTKILEQQNFGKYWQTVRDQDQVNLNFPNPPAELIEKIDYLRTVNTQRGIYGGNGWANYAASYFNDCYRFVQGLRYVLKPSASAFVVIGNSILQGVMFPTDVYLGKIAEQSGLDLVSINTPRDARVGNSIIQSKVRVAKADKACRLYESVVELRQPK
jgi:DNA modification methylase